MSRRRGSYGVNIDNMISDWFIDRFHGELSWLLSRVRNWERALGPDDDWVEDDRRLLFESLDWLLRPAGRPTIGEVPVEDHVLTVSASPDRVEELLAESDYQRNLLSTRKYRDLAPENGGRQYAVGSWVLDPSDTDWQHHVYLFPTPQGGTEVYSHKEPSVRDPDAHVDPETGVHGDPDGLLDEVFE